MRRTVPRRYRNTIFLAGCILSVCLVSCKANTGKISQYSAPRDTLRLFFSPLDAFDPVHNDKANQTLLLAAIHGRLFHYDAEKDRLVHGLVKRYKVSADKRIWSFTLRSARTPDGHPLSVGDIVFSLALYQDPAYLSSLRTTLSIDGQPLQIKKTGPLSFEVRLPRAVPHLAWLLSGLFVLPRAVYGPLAAKKSKSWRRALSRDAKLSWLRGFGPFYVAEKNKQAIVLHRNPGFGLQDMQGKELPYLKRIHLLLNDDESLLQYRFKKDPSVPGMVVDALSAKVDYKEEKLWHRKTLGVDGSTLFWWLNQAPVKDSVIPQAKQKLFRDVRFRRAIAAMMDRRKVIQSAFYGEATALYGPVSSAFQFSAPTQTLRSVTPAYNIQKARAMLKELGLKEKDGYFLYEKKLGQWEPLKILLNTTPSPGDMREKAALEVVRQLRKGGIQASVSVISFRSAVTRIMSTRDYEALLMFLEASPHPASSKSMYLSNGNMHFFDPAQKKPRHAWEGRIDQLFSRSMSALSAKESIQYFQQLQMIWVKHMPVFYLATRKPLLILRTNHHLRGYVQNGRAVHPFLARPQLESLRYASSGDVSR